MASETTDSDLAHATVVVLDGRGVLVSGPSGSGKTLLALELLHRARLAGIPSALVADDYVYLVREGEILVAVTPDPIARMIELRGFGILALDAQRHQARAAVDLVVRLVDPAETERVHDPDRMAEFCNLRVPELALEQRTPLGSTYAIFGWLGLGSRIL